LYTNHIFVCVSFIIFKCLNDHYALTMLFKSLLSGYNASALALNKRLIDRRNKVERINIAYCSYCFCHTGEYGWSQGMDE